MQDEDITFFAGVPTMYWGLLGALKEAGDSVDVDKVAANLRVAAAAAPRFRSRCTRTSRTSSG